MFLKISFPQWNIVANFELLFQCAFKVSKKLNSKYMFTLKIILLLLFFSHSVLSDSLRLHGLQHSRFPCPSLPPGVYSNSCPLSWWCHWTSVSSVAPTPPGQHQGLFHWVSSLYQVAKVLKLQVQHQSFQWIFTIDFL